MPDDDVITPPDSDTGQVAGQESSLSNWAGESVTDMLGRADALSQVPYESYDGPLSAGSSELQDQGFGGIAGLTLPDEYGEASGMASEVYDQSQLAGQYDSSNISTGQWNNDYANQYMNPYIQQALDPQLQEMARQSQIQSLQDNYQLTKAGAYGGSRQALMNSESNDNMMRLMAELTGEGYQNAYDTAGRMFSSDQGRMLDANKFNEQSRQFGAGLGLEALRTGLDSARTLADTTNMGLNAERNIYGDQIDAGGIQRGITSEGIAADKAQFEEERDDPYRKLEWYNNFYNGKPLTAQNTTYTEQDFLSKLLSGTGGIAQLLEWLKGNGELPTTNPDTPTEPTTNDDTQGGIQV